MGKIFFEQAFLLSMDSLDMKNVDKVLFLLGACFDLISGSSLHINIQIMGGKVTENLEFKSLLQKVKKYFQHVLFDF